MGSKRRRQTAVTRAGTSSEYLSDERCYIKELLNGPEEPQLSIAQARVTPGETTAWHQLDGVKEYYVIVSGEAEVEVGNEPPVAVGKGDIVTIPSGVRQRITNTGDGDLTFLCICMPRFEWRYYQCLEP